MRIILAVLVLLAVSGCKASEQYVKADAATFDAISPEYLKYADADPALDADQKARRHRLVESWAIRIRENR